MNRVRALGKTVAAVAGVILVAGLPVAVASPNVGAVDGETAAMHATTLRLHTLSQMRRATARFHGIATAESEGYVPFTDVDGISCIAEPGMGGMGVHYVNPQLIADPAIDPRKPEALVYAPAADGTLHLAALEYLVDQAAWDTQHPRRPQLFAHQRFDATDAPNRFGLDPFYSQHVWVWKQNPAGLLAMWNPNVRCSRR